jgi:hypothetical protein
MLVLALNALVTRLTGGGHERVSRGSGDSMLTRLRRLVWTR